MTGFAPGDLAVLNIQLARDLLASPIPARVAYVAKSGEPRVVPLWFHWDGTDLVMATFNGSPKLSHVHTGDRLAVTIDTEAFPYAALQIRGPVTVTAHDGVVLEYRFAARRYLGEDGEAFVAGIQPPPAMTRIALRPEWARAMNMRD
jgi:Pyridoxamine 5'-phosphate oxidase